jgi:hypothetical protein
LKEEVMKKNLLVLVVLLLTFGLTMGFAQELTATVGGSGTVTFGYDLDTGAMGFENASTATIALTLIPSATAEEDPMAGSVYGYIKLADYTITMNETDGTTITAPAITAKIMADPIYVQIFAQDGLAVGQATMVEDAAAGVEGDDTDLAPDLTNYGGIIIGAALDPITLSLFLASGTGYSAATDTANDWAFGADVGLTAGPATITGEFVQSINQDDNKTGIGAKIALDVAPLSPYVAFDADNTAAGGFLFEAALGTGLDLGNSSTIALAASYSEAADADVEVTITEDASAGFVPNLGVGLTVGVYDLTSTIAWRVAASTSYAIPDTATISLETGYDSASTIPLTASVAVTAITNVTFTLKFVSTSLTATGGVAQDGGVVTFATEISF